MAAATPVAALVPGSGLASAHPLPPAGLSSVLALVQVGSPLVAFVHLAHLDSLSSCPEAAWGQSHPCPQRPSSFLPISVVWGLWSASTPRPPRPSLWSRDSGLRLLLLFSLTLGPLSWQPPLSPNGGCAALPFTSSNPSAAWAPGLPQGWLPSLLIRSPAPWAQGWPRSLPLSSLWFSSCRSAAAETPAPIRQRPPCAGASYPLCSLHRRPEGSAHSLGVPALPLGSGFPCLLSVLPAVCHPPLPAPPPPPPASVVQIGA